MRWLRREAIVLAVCGGFGLLVLPALVYLVGERLLGEYQPGATMGTFYADIYGQLATPSVWAWLLVLGPWLAILLLRLLWFPLGWLGRHRALAAEDEDVQPPSLKHRIEPTI
jgi:hypothetical protein